MVMKKVQIDDVGQIIEEKKRMSTIFSCSRGYCFIYTNLSINDIIWFSYDSIDFITHNFYINYIYFLLLDNFILYATKSSTYKLSIILSI